MRTTSGRRNRAALLLGGGLMMIAALWVASAATPLRDLWPEAAPVLPHGGSAAADTVAAHQSWLLPAALAASVLVAAAGIILLVAQVPTAPTRSALRITDHDDRLLGSVDPEVVERALTDAVENASGVTDASLRLGGGAGAPWIQATVTVAQDAETGWVAEHVRGRLVDDVSTVLGVAPVRVDLLVRLRSGRAPNTAQLQAPRSSTRTTETVAA